MIDSGFIPTLTQAIEPDVDLLLVEELYASGDFVLWMAAEVGMSKPIRQWDVKHSKRRTQSRRVIDSFSDQQNLLAYGIERRILLKHWPIKNRTVL